RIYSELQAAGFDVLYMDEDKARLGVMLVDVELIGIPHRIVVGDRGLQEGQVEYRHRRATDNEMLPLADLVAELQKRSK
ncbi:MAG TPA: His/Gly/Thr/Pro-type tRNA ligase C-terminal domain-containing protein, partial [Pseudomonadales bacterium]|nr:His/Gly/Thr/Pro-type tRNA ligase C-terminal domain-containing protein [Pseudomonadales bacterium]